MLRVVHDTNVAVSALLFREGRLAWLRDAWAAGTVVPVVCGSTLGELEQVLLYPKFDLAAHEVSVLLALIRTPRYASPAAATKTIGFFSASRTPRGRTPLSAATRIYSRLPPGRAYESSLPRDCARSWSRPLGSSSRAPGTG